MSKFLFVPLAVAGLALVAACGGRQPQPVVVVPPAPVVTTPPASAQPGPAVVQSVPQIRAGMGRIESIAPATSASAGGTAPSMNRLNIRMDDGSMQVVDTPSTGFSNGDRVELTREGYIRRIPA
jgi:hypothetical protein